MTSPTSFPASNLIMGWARYLYSSIRLGLRSFWGNTFNLLWFPGFVRNCDYQASVCDASVTVRTRDLFTVVTVNGLDIYFHRLTGKIDGVGFNPNAGCTLDAKQESARPDVRRAS
jgi:hypothetical protein